MGRPPTNSAGQSDSRIEARSILHSNQRPVVLSAQPRTRPQNDPPVLTSMPMLRLLPSLTAWRCRSLLRTSVASNPLLSASCAREGAGEKEGWGGAQAGQNMTSTVPPTSARQRN